LTLEVDGHLSHLGGVIRVPRFNCETLVRSGFDQAMRRKVPKTRLDICPMLVWFCAEFRDNSIGHLAGVDSNGLRAEKCKKPSDIFPRWICVRTFVRIVLPMDANVHHQIDFLMRMHVM
jgi:hypothetical protein